MRLLIAIPCMDTVRYEFAESLANLCKHLSDIGIDYELKWHATSLIYMAREELSNHAINEYGQDGYVLWLDSDMVFTPDCFDLLRSLNTDFATGCYRTRRPPYCFVMERLDDPSLRVDKLPKEPFEIASCGFGMVLISTKALFKVRSNFGSCFTPTPSTGEDYAFCNRWLTLSKENKIIAHPDAVADHIAYVRLRCDDPHYLVDYQEKR